MTREEKIASIKKTMGTTWIGIPGHSVCSHELFMIGDVLHYVEKTVKKKFFRETNSVGILDHWNDRRASIDQQTDDCVDYVYSFIESK